MSDSPFPRGDLARLVLEVQRLRDEAAELLQRAAELEKEIRDVLGLSGSPSVEPDANRN